MKFYRRLNYSYQITDVDHDENSLPGPSDKNRASLESIHILCFQTYSKHNEICCQWHHQSGRLFTALVVADPTQFTDHSSVLKPSFEEEDTCEKYDAPEDLTSLSNSSTSKKPRIESYEVSGSGSVRRTILRMITMLTLV